MTNLFKSLAITFSLLVASFSWANPAEVNINTADAVTRFRSFFKLTNQSIYSCCYSVF